MAKRKKTTKSKTSRKKLILTLLIFSVVVCIIVWFRQNTSFLTFIIPPDEIVENNLNNTIVDKTALETLVPVDVAIPNDMREAPFDQPRTLFLPKDFSIEVYHAGLNAPRFFVFDQNNTMFVADRKAGTLLAIPDKLNNPEAEHIVLDTNMSNPHSVYLYKGDLFLAEENNINVYRQIKSDGTFKQKDVIIDNLPDGNTLTGGGHTTRTIVVGPDEKLYISIGSSCNVCEEDDDRRAAIIRSDLDGSNQEIFATGLRNSVGLGFLGDELWAVNNGRDRIGDDIPSEEVNIIRKGNHYGWPYCYDDGVQSPEYTNKEKFCQNETTFPEYKMQAHSAPLGMIFTNNSSIDIYKENMANEMIIAFHGSWNRTVPTGYKVVRLNTSDENAEPVNFVSGWLEENGEAWGRPVGVNFDSRGDLYISDDKAGAIYRVTYHGEN